MKQRLFLLCAALLSFSCTNPLTPFDDPLYPTILLPLDSAELIAAREEYQAVNPRACTDLDEFGFTDSCSRSGVGVNPAAWEVLASMAKHAVTRNSRFTNVTDLESVGFQIHTSSNSSDLLVQFDGQVWSGIPVLDTAVYTRVDSLGLLSISGHWYADIHIPAHRKLNARAAQQSLLGRGFDVGSFPDEDELIIVRQDSFLGEPTPAIVPLKPENGTLELRLTWRVDVARSGNEKPELTIYVDAMRGDVVRTQF